MPPKSKSLSVPEAMQPRYQEIADLIDALCREKLNAEYALVCKELTATLARKRQIQEEAYRKGLIPYLPGDKSGE